MSVLAELNPDEVLAKLLDNVVEVQTSKTQKHKIRAYAQSQQPNKYLGDEFIKIQLNGIINSLTKPLGFIRGNIALMICVKTDTYNRANTRRVNQIIQQCETLANEVTAQGYYFELSPTNVITPTTTNLTDGYSTTILNVEWHN